MSKKPKKNNIYKQIFGMLHLHGEIFLNNAKMSKVATIQKELDAENIGNNPNNGSSSSGCLVTQHVFSFMFIPSPSKCSMFLKINDRFLMKELFSSIPKAPANLS